VVIRDPRLEGGSMTLRPDGSACVPLFVSMTDALGRRTPLSTGNRTTTVLSRRPPRKKRKEKKVTATPSHSPKLQLADPYDADPHQGLQGGKGYTSWSKIPGALEPTGFSIWKRIVS